MRDKIKPIPKLNKEEANDLRNRFREKYPNLFAGWSSTPKTKSMENKMQSKEIFQLGLLLGRKEIELVKGLKAARDSLPPPAPWALHQPSAPRTTDEHPSVVRAVGELAGFRNALGCVANALADTN